MLIKIIRLHVSLELPDGDCIGGRLQLESFLSCFFFPALKQKKKKGGKKGKKKEGSFGVYGMAVWGLPVTVCSVSACV